MERSPDPRGVAERRYVMPDDVVVVATAEASTELAPGEVAMTRRGHRGRPVVLSADAATLLESFRTPRTVVDALADHCRERGLDAMPLLDEAFAVLARLTRARLLVAMDADDAQAPQLRCTPGDRIGPAVLVEAVRCLDDTEVWRAEGVDHDGGLAVKVLSGAAGRHLIEREVAALTRLAPLAERGRVCELRHHRLDPGDDVATVVTGWLDGAPLDVAATLLGEPDRQPGAIARRHLAAAVVELFAEIHELGVRHGDVHAGNVIVRPDGRPAAYDFGLAGVSGTDRPTPLRTTALDRLSPEAARARLVQGDVGTSTTAPPTDAEEQYDVAALAYAVIAGSTHRDLPAGHSDPLPALARAGMRSLADAGALAWPAGEAVLAQALSADPAARFADLRAFCAALAAAVARLPEVAAFEPGHDDAAARLMAAYAVSDIPTQPVAVPLCAYEPDGLLWRRASGERAEQVAAALRRLASLSADAQAGDLADLWACHPASSPDGDDAGSERPADLQRAVARHERADPWQVAQLRA